MAISARNQLKGIIKSIKQGVVNSSVVIETASGDIITSTITLDAVKELELAEGKEVVAVIKATEVMIGIGDLKISARNQIDCKVTEIKEGAVNAIVVLVTNGGDMLSSTISLTGCKELGLMAGASVKAVIKATSVMIAI